MYTTRKRANNKAMENTVLTNTFHYDTLLILSSFPLHSCLPLYMHLSIQFQSEAGHVFSKILGGDNSPTPSIVCVIHQSKDLHPIT